MNMIPIENVMVGKRLRQIRPEAVEALAQSIREVGLINPILVTPLPEEQEMFRLVAGNHRLEACRRLGMSDIAANIVTSLDVDQRLAEIDENLCRVELTHLERAEHLAERKSLYEVKYPQTKSGTAGVHGANRSMGRSSDANEIISFASDTSQKTGSTTRIIQQAVRRATNISQEVRDTIRTVEAIADNSLELDALANLEEPEQKAAVQAVLDGKARSVREVVRQKEGTPHPPTPEKQTSAAANENAELQEWKRQAKEASSEVMAAKGNIRTLKRQLSELKTRIKELEATPPTPVTPSADLEAWKARALEAEEGCIVLQHRMTEMEQANSSPHNQGSRGLALRSLLDELETALKTTPAEFRPDVLDWFEECFMNLVFLIKNIKRQAN